MYKKKNAQSYSEFIYNALFPKTTHVDFSSQSCPLMAISISNDEGHWTPYEIKF